MCHMGHTQEAYNTECTALACVLEWISGGYVPDRVTIFMDACRRTIPGVVDTTPRVASMAASMASRVCGT